MYYPSGVISSLVTNLDASGEIDVDGLRRNVTFQKRAGVKGICILGGTGEPLSLSRHERIRIIEATVESAAGALDVVVGALVGNPDEVLHDVKAAKERGADACLVIPPPFVRPSERDAEKFFTTLAGVGMPLILFNSPSRSGFSMSTGLIARLAQVEYVVGIKESSRDIIQLQEVRQQCPPSFSVLQGVDSLFMASLAMGADGGILAAAAVVPEVCVRIQKSVEEGDLRTARKLHSLLTPLIKVMYESSHPAPLKIALESRGLRGGPCRPPFYGLTDDHVKRIRRVMLDINAYLEGTATTDP